MSLTHQIKQPVHLMSLKVNQTTFNVLMGLGIVLVLAIHLIFLTRYPAVFIDESWNSNAVWTWLQTGTLFDSIHAGTLDQFGHEWLRRPYLGSIPWLISFGTFGLGLFQARLVSWFFGLILLLATIEVGRRLYSLTTGLLAAFCLSLTAPFLSGSHYARQDIILAVFLMASFGLAWEALEKEKWWLHFLSGLVLALSIDVHENGALFIPALAALYLLTYKTTLLTKTGTWFVALGGLTGIVYFVAAHILPDPAAYFTLSSFRFSAVAHDYRMPISTLNIWTLLKSVDGQIGIYHFYTNGLDFAIIGAGLVFIAYRRRRSDFFLLTLIVVSFLSFVLFQGSKPWYYAIHLYPFFMLAVAATLVALLQKKSVEPGQTIFVGMLLVLFLFNGLAHTVKPAIQNRDYNFYALADQVKADIEPGDRVLGSPMWWLGLNNYEYRSFENLNYYRFFNKYSFTEALAEIHPDIIIVEPIYRGEFEMEGVDQEFNAFLEAHGTKLQDFTAQTDLEDGQIEVYRIEW